MDVLQLLTDYMVPVIVGICLCLGYVIKHWVKDVDNRYIPTISAVIGVGLAVWIYWGNITPEALLSGLFSGLAATGLHQAFTQVIHKKE